MRGQQERSGSLFSYVSIEERIPGPRPQQWCNSPGTPTPA